MGGNGGGPRGKEVNNDEERAARRQKWLTYLRNLEEEAFHPYQVEASHRWEEMGVHREALREILVHLEGMVVELGRKVSSNQDRRRIMYVRPPNPGGGPPKPIGPPN